MILNLGQFASRATEMAAGRQDWALSDASFWINCAYSELFNKVAQTPLESIAISSTTSGGSRIALPPDYQYGIALTLYQGSSSTVSTSHTTAVIRLREQDAGWIDAQTVSPAGVPEAYVQYGTALELWPSPNSAYSLQLRYAVKPPMLIASTDTPMLDERWHPGLLYKSVELLEASRNNVEGEAIARNRYISFMQSMPRDREMKQQDRSAMRVRFVRKLD